MVESVIKIFNKEVGGVHQAAFLLGFFALLSQILALVRDKLLAYSFGASTSLDLYYAAFRIPDFLFVTIGSLVSLSVLIPFLIGEQEKGAERYQTFVDNIFTFFIWLILAVSVIVFFLTPLLIDKLFPGFSAREIEITISLARIILLSPILLGISNLFGSLIQSRNRFFVYAISPLLYNIGIILGILFLYPYFGLSGLAWGVIVGAALHLLVQVPTVLHLGVLPKLTLKPNFSCIKKVLFLSFPRTFTLSVSHIVIFFLLSFASLMTAGSISIFNLAFNLQSVPLSIFGVSYSMAAFPTLSRFFVSGEKEKFLSQFLISARHILFWVVPSSVLFIVLRAHIVRIVLGAGQFDWTDTRLTAAVLALFCVSLVFQSLVLLFVRALYSMGSTGKPFYITFLSGISTILFSYIFVRLFELFPTFRYFMETLLKIPDISGSVVSMLALGFTFGSILEGTLIWILFNKYCKGFSSPLLASLFRVFSASVIMGFVTFLSLRFFNLFISLDTFWGVFTQATLSALCGIISLVFVLRALESPELTDIQKTLHQKFWKTKTLSPDAELL